MNKSALEREKKHSVASTSITDKTDRQEGWFRQHCRLTQLKSCRFFSCARMARIYATNQDATPKQVTCKPVNCGRSRGASLPHVSWQNSTFGFFSLCDLQQGIMAIEGQKGILLTLRTFR